jgi:predicted nucleotidyltransferase
MSWPRPLASPYGTRQAAASGGDSSARTASRPFASHPGARDTGSQCPAVYKMTLKQQLGPLRSRIGRKCTHALCPQARIILFGSRANGTGEPDSDYGLLVILPDDVGQSTRSAIMSDVHIMAQQLGTEFDREHVSDEYVAESWAC